jgi:hypothetical protein
VRYCGLENASARSHAAFRQLGSTHQATTCDVAVGITASHTYKNLTILKHLEPPIGHGRSVQKERERTDWGSSNPTLYRYRWLLDATPSVAPLRRPWTGFIAPTFKWLDYADLRLAPLRRLSGGSITPTLLWLLYADR